MTIPNSDVRGQFFHISRLRRVDTGQACIVYVECSLTLGVESLVTPVIRPRLVVGKRSSPLNEPCGFQSALTRGRSTTAIIFRGKRREEDFVRTDRERLNLPAPIEHKLTLTNCHAVGDDERV